MPGCKGDMDAGLVPARLASAIPMQAPALPLFARDSMGR